MKLLVLIVIITVVIVTVYTLLEEKKRKKESKSIKYNQEIKYNQVNEFKNEIPVINEVEPQQITIYPYHQKYLLTKYEYNFYQQLKKITEPLNLQILAKIRLADLIEVNSGLSQSDWSKYFNKIKSKHIDFAIANNMKIITLIELDDNSHQRNERQERDVFVNNALINAGYTVVRTNGNTNIIEQALIDKGYHKNLYTNMN